MRICPHCGGFFDETILICPIDGYDFSIALKEEKRRRIIARIKRISKYVFCASLMLSIISSLLIIAFSGVFSGSSTFQGRIYCITAQKKQLVPTNNLQQRISYIGNNLEIINNRFQGAYINKGEITIRSSVLKENTAIAEKRFAVFHVDFDRITKRWLFAVNQGKLHYNSLRTTSD